MIDNHFEIENFTFNDAYRMVDNCIISAKNSGIIPKNFVMDNDTKEVVARFLMSLSKSENASIILFRGICMGFLIGYMRGQGRVEII